MTAGRILLFALCAWVTIPHVPGPLGTGLDPSYLYGLNMAWRQGLVHGRDFVFTYGPLAWLLFPDPGIVPQWAVLLYHLMLYAGGLLFLFRMALSPRLELRACAAVWTAAMAVCTHPVEQLQFTVLGLMAAFLQSSGSFAIGLAAAFSAGIALAVKANEGIVAVAVLGASIAHHAIRQGFRPRLAALLILPCAIAAAATGPGHFPSFLRWAIELSSGYSEAMGYSGPMWQFAAGVSGIGILAAIALSGRRPFALALLAAALPAFLVAFGAWKHAMVRQDGHAAPLHAKLAIAAVLLASVSGSVRALAATGYAAISIAVAIPIMIAAFGPIMAEQYRAALFERPRRTAHAWLHFTAYWNSLRSANQTDRSRLTLAPRVMAAIDGKSVEAVPYSIDVIRANRLEWRPRPVIQTYSAYTPGLDSLNAVHIAGPRAASRVLLEYAPVDDRHPFLADPRSMLALVDNYDLLVLDAPFAVLARRETPRFDAETPVGQVSAAWDEIVAPPPAQQGVRLIARIVIRPSWEGRLRSFAFRTVPVFLEERYASGRSKAARIVPFNLGGGALFVGRPESIGELAKAFGPQREPEDALVGFRFFTPGEREFEPRIRIEWSSVRERTAH